MEHLPNCQCFLHRVLLGSTKRNEPSQIEAWLCDVLLAEFPCVERGRRFGRFIVDAYLPPPYHLAFEADGIFWHDETADHRRDQILLEQYNLPVVRVGEVEIRALMGTPFSQARIDYAKRAGARMRARLNKDTRCVKIPSGECNK